MKASSSVSHSTILALSMIKLYIAGPMRSIPEFNFPAFHAAAKTLREMGFHVFSPAEMDAIFTPSGELDPVHKYVRRDLHIIVNELHPPNDGLVMLPGWADSTGARAERAVGLWCGLKIMHFVDPGELRVPGQSVLRAEAQDGRILSESI